MTIPIAQVIHASESKTLEFKRDLSSRGSDFSEIRRKDRLSIPGIFREVKANNLPEPLIEELAGRVRFTVPLAEILPVSREQSRKTKPVQAGVQFTQAGEQIGEQVDEQVSEQAVHILRACASGPQSKSELLGAAGLASVYLNYKRHLLPLLEHGLIERTIPDKPTSRLQKYRLTVKGRRVLEEE